MKKMRIEIFVLCFLFLFLGGTTGMAAYPDRPIKLIIPWSVGGGTETLWRILQPPLEKELGQRVLLDPVPGGSTKIGTMKAIKSDPDGYTLLFTPHEAWVPYYINGIYDEKPWEVMVPIANTVREAYIVLSVKTNSPYKTIKDLMTLGKGKRLTWATPSEGGLIQQVAITFAKASGIDIATVPFAGSGPVKLALLGGHVDMAGGQPSEAIETERSGETRVLAVSSSNRLSAFPNAPTFKEVGLDIVADFTRSFWGPPGLPQTIVNTFSAAVKRACQDPKFIKQANDLFLLAVDYQNPQETLADVRRFEKVWGSRIEEFKKKK